MDIPIQTRDSLLDASPDAPAVTAGELPMHVVPGEFPLWSVTDALAKGGRVVWPMAGQVLLSVVALACFTPFPAFTGASVAMLVSRITMSGQFLANAIGFAAGASVWALIAGVLFGRIAIITLDEIRFRLMVPRAVSLAKDFGLAKPVISAELFFLRAMGLPICALMIGATALGANSTRLGKPGESVFLGAGIAIGGGAVLLAWRGCWAFIDRDRPDLPVRGRLAMLNAIARAAWGRFAVLHLIFAVPVVAMIGVSVFQPVALGKWKSAIEAVGWPAVIFVAIPCWFGSWAYAYDCMSAVIVPARFARAVSDPRPLAGAPPK